MKLYLGNSKENKERVNRLLGDFSAPGLELSFFKQLTITDIKLILTLSAKADKVREIFVGREISGIFQPC
jgi:hypothetical protein